MKLFIVLFFAASASAGRLINSYLPPSSAGSAGGSGVIINAPLNPLPSPNARIPSGPSSQPGQQIPIVKLNNDNNGEGSYRYEYETANHISAQESGRLAGSDNLEAQGSFSYLAPNGQTISLTYTADENGFQPSGEHLPTSPPVPEEILKSLEINAAEEARGIFDDGQYRPSPSELDVGRNAGPGASSQYLPPSNQKGGYRY